LLPSAASAPAATLNFLDQVETGSAITWKYPSCILQGDNSIGEFYSVALTNPRTGRPTPHQDDSPWVRTRARQSSRKESLRRKANNSYRGLVKNHAQGRERAQLYAVRFNADGSNCGAKHVPYIEVMNNTSRVEHEASTFQDQREQLFYLMQRGISQEDAVSLIINGFCKDVFLHLPMEFAGKRRACWG